MSISRNRIRPIISNQPNPERRHHAGPTLPVFRRSLRRSDRVLSQGAWHAQLDVNFDVSPMHDIYCVDSDRWQHCGRAGRARYDAVWVQHKHPVRESERKDESLQATGNTDKGDDHD